jgi:hypothetical protein
LSGTGNKQSIIIGNTKDAEKPVKKILILSANPKNTGRLRLDEEVREIKEALRRSKNWDQLKIETVFALRLRDLRRSLLDHEPEIVHFTGHGTTKGLVLEGPLGFSTTISSKALSQLFKLFSQQVECVILSACYSLKQVNTINKYIPYVIGMRKEIQAKAAIEFAVGFYDALGAGRPVKDAFQFGCQAILQTFPDTADHLVPVMKTG